MIVSLENGTIILYLAIAAVITVKLGAVLYKTGSVLLFYVFSDQKEWATPVQNAVCVNEIINIKTLILIKGICFKFIFWGN